MSFLKYDFNSRSLKVISPEIFLLDSFKKIAEACRTEEEMQRELAFVHLMTWHKSPFIKYTNKVEKIEEHLKIKINERIIKAIEDIEDLVVPFEIEFLMTCIETAKKTKNHFESIDYSERDKSNKPIYKPKDVLNALEAVPNTLAALEKALNNIQETDSVSSIVGRGQRTISSKEEPKEKNKRNII